MQEELSNPDAQPPISSELKRKSLGTWQRYTVIVLVVSLFSSLAFIGFSSLRSEPTSGIGKNPGGLSNVTNSMSFPIVFKACGKWSELVEKSKDDSTSLDQMTKLITEIDDIAQSSKSLLLKTSTKNLKDAIIAGDIAEFTAVIPTLNQICNNFPNNDDSK